MQLPQTTKPQMMNIDEFTARFAELFDDTPASAITPSTAFHDLDEYSSLISLTLIAMVDDEYGVTLSGNDIRSATTVEDLFNTVKGKA